MRGLEGQCLRICIIGAVEFFKSVITQVVDLQVLSAHSLRECICYSYLDLLTELFHSISCDVQVDVDDDCVVTELLLVFLRHIHGLGLECEFSRRKVHCLQRG